MKGLCIHSSGQTLCFDSFNDNGSSIRLIDREQDKEVNVQVSIQHHAFKHRIQKDFPSIIADVIDLAVAVHAADRLTIQDLWQPQIQLQIVLPARHPEILNQSSIQQRLSKLLEWTTGKKWRFDFVERSELGRSIENEPRLWSSDPDVDEVALWSGGLDALAGLYTRLNRSPERSVALFGTGSNDNNHKRQQDVFHALQPLFPNRLDLCRAPIRFSESTNQGKNKFSRARGFVFMLLGCAYAYLRGSKVLHVYENGIGAINLHYRKSAVGLDHSRSVHPETLLGVGNFMSELIGEHFRVWNPFLYSTKTEMCWQLAEDARSELVLLTSSCDSPHRRKPTQCGYCTSCILRKQALAASHLEDKTRYIVPHAAQPLGDVWLHLQIMLAQVSTLRKRLKDSDQAIHQWASLTQRFPELDDIVDRTHGEEGLTLLDMRNKLIRLYQAYVSEWATVEPQILEQFESRPRNKQVVQQSQLSIQEGSQCL